MTTTAREREVARATIATPVGRMRAVAGPRGLRALAYLTDDDRVRDLPGCAAAQETLERLRSELEGYFAGRVRAFGVTIDPLAIEGFAAVVLDRTARIPYGETLSYGELAQAVGRPRAARAVGNALGANPMPIVIPCHRVTRSGGAAGGYTGGADIKRVLLALETGESRPLARRAA